MNKNLNILQKRKYTDANKHMKKTLNITTDL